MGKLAELAGQMANGLASMIQANPTQGRDEHNRCIMGSQTGVPDPRVGWRRDGEPLREIASLAISR